MIMLGMGLTLRIEDFRHVLAQPSTVLVGVVGQYLIMPLCGWAIAEAFQLERHHAAGLILVACCPGGTASNVIAFLAKADVALSVSMTTVSTVAAVVLTPTLASALVGNRIAVDAFALMWTTAQVVIVPVGTGVALRRYAPQAIERLLPYAPPVAVLAIVLIVASILGAGREQLLGGGMLMMLAVVSLHTCGFALGYLAAAVLRRDARTRATVSIEVGMQNSGLGVVLARAHFASPLVAIPSALSSVVHSLIGSALAAMWRRGLER